MGKNAGKKLKQNEKNRAVSYLQQVLAPPLTRSKAKEMHVHINDFFELFADNITSAHPAIIVGNEIYDDARVKHQINPNPLHHRKEDFYKYLGDSKVLPAETTYLSNNYSYKTDTKRRIEEAKGNLKLLPGTRALQFCESAKKYYGFIDGTDDAGHLIGHQFGGSDKLENLVPMHRELNQRKFVVLENFLANILKLKKMEEAKEVKADLGKIETLFEVKPKYDDGKMTDSNDNNRPISFDVQYEIKNFPSKNTITFNNPK